LCSFQINPRDLIDKRFRIRRIQFNTYEIDHAEVTGQLRLLSIPTNILEVPQRLVPQSAPRPNTPAFMIGYQAIATFTSANERHEIRLANQNEIENARLVELTPFIQGNPVEPWNEFIIQGTPAIVIRTRTILTRVDWLRDYTDSLGGPAISTNHNTTHSVSVVEAGEAGMT